MLPQSDAIFLYVFQKMWYENGLFKNVLHLHLNIDNQSITQGVPGVFEQPFK